MNETVAFTNIGTTEKVNVAWDVKYEAAESWTTFASGLKKNAASLAFTIKGIHQIRCTLNKKESSAATASVVAGGNNYPVVLVGGFIMWGRNEFDLTDLSGNTVYNWGQSSGDLEKQLNDMGFDVFTANVGPVDSAWDRACELYAALTGGTYVKAGADKRTVNYVPEDGYYVDYGHKHASKFNQMALERGLIKSGQTAHYRFANSACVTLANSRSEKFTDKYKFPKDPVHLVVHSFGGHTARVLMGLLKNGSPDGDEGDALYSQSELFKGGHINYVRSLTTICTPHNGTNIIFFVNTMFDFFDHITGGLVNIIEIAMGNLLNFLKPVYNFDLGQLAVQVDHAIMEGIHSTATAKICHGEACLRNPVPRSSGRPSRLHRTDGQNRQ